MKNTEIADIQVKRIREVIDRAASTKEFQISMEDLLNILASLERLSILERHLVNLVSTAYEEHHA